MLLMTNDSIRPNIVYSAPWSHGRGNCALVKVDDATTVKIIASGRGDYASSQSAPQLPDTVLVDIANSAYRLAQEAITSDPLSPTMSLQLYGPYDFVGHSFRFLSGTAIVGVGANKVIEIEIM
jgi:hypothetical protein